MEFKVLTLFPELVNCFFAHGMIGRTIEKELIKGTIINIRDFTHDRHKTVDDKPYGGGSGMIMKPEPLKEAIEYARKDSKDSKVVLMTPQGTKFSQEKAINLVLEKKDLIFICGRYEGVDERIYTNFVDEEISIGDYVMTGGELAAMTIIDSVARLIPGVLGSRTSAKTDSFIDDRLEYAQYTRPAEFEGVKVPDILLSGNHEKIEEYRISSSLKRTFLKRPDLFDKSSLNKKEKIIIEQWLRQLEKLINE